MAWHEIPDHSTGGTKWVGEGEFRNFQETKNAVVPFAFAGGAGYLIAGWIGLENRWIGVVVAIAALLIAWAYRAVKNRE